MTKHECASAAGGGAPTNNATLDDALAAIETAAAQPAAKTEPPAVSAKPARDAALAGVRWPPGYAMTPDGCWTFTAPGDDAAPIFLSKAFAIVGRCRDESSARWGLVIRFNDPDNIEKTAVIAAADLVGDAVSVRQRLTGLGLEIAVRKAARERFVEGLASVQVDGRVLVVDRAGWTCNYKVFVLPERSFGGVEQTVIEGTAAAVTSMAGTMSGWREWVHRHAATHSRLVFALCVALASPLLGLVGGEACVFHTRGRSSSGKSTLLVVAASIWGAPGSVLSWRGTANSFEGVAALRSHILLCLDELGIADCRTVSDTIFTLTNGIAKTRMRSDGSMKPVATWQVFGLSSGRGLIGRQARRGWSS